MPAAPTTATTTRCAKQIWVPVRPGGRTRRLAPCPRPGTVAVQWGTERALVCLPCADELRDGRRIHACRLPDGDTIAALTDHDIREIRSICARLAADAGVAFTVTQRGITAAIRHWGRQSAALRALRGRGFEALQPSDNPTVRVVGRRRAAGSADPSPSSPRADVVELLEDAP